MSDEMIGELSKMAEGQIAEQLGASQLGEMAEKFGLGDANDLVSKAAGMFGGHAPQSEADKTSESGEDASEAPEAPAQDTEESEPQTEGDNE